MKVAEKQAVVCTVELKRSGAIRSWPGDVGVERLGAVTTRPRFAGKEAWRQDRIGRSSLLGDRIYHWRRRKASQTKVGGQAFPELAGSGPAIRK